MIRYYLLAAGMCMLLLQLFVSPFGPDLQLTLFIAGILFLGVPHGAADLLVAMHNADSKGESFSMGRFFAGYIGRLMLFAAMLWQFPAIGILVFIVFSAYHFGETDLSLFDTTTVSGKYFVIAYGMLILGVMLLMHADEVRPFIALAGISPIADSVFTWLETHRAVVLQMLVVQLLVSAGIFFSLQRSERKKLDMRTLIFYIVILLILSKLPLIMGFTFYFVGWHSVLSIRKITSYLCHVNGVPIRQVIRQIALYSLLAIAGIIIAGSLGFMFADHTSLMWYSIMGLAVLTAPHMEVMHEMYNRLRPR